ncbi:hypothetical protein LC609_32635 [Nostoc sp. XA013]|nr:hypothetical protein [Nostoc sp. XA013]
MTATITRPKLKKAAARKPESPYKRLHVIIPIEDMLWASQQKPSVTQLWQECWTADPYGSRWMSLSTGMGYSTFISAKKILSDRLYILPHFLHQLFDAGWSLFPI